MRSRLVAFAVIALACALVLWPPRPARHDLRITFIDVGQGDAILVQTPRGHSLMIDTGGKLERGKTLEGASVAEEVGERVVVPFLIRQGIHHVDAILLTHPHGDQTAYRIQKTYANTARLYTNCEGRILTPRRGEVPGQSRLRMVQLSRYPGAYRIGNSSPLKRRTTGFLKMSSRSRTCAMNARCSSPHSGTSSSIKSREKPLPFSGNSVAIPTTVVPAIPSWSI